MFNDFFNENIYNISKFRVDQIECLCKILENSLNIDKLEKFLNYFLNNIHILPELTDNDRCSKKELTDCHQQLLRAKALVLFHTHKFDQFYEFIETNQFAIEHHSYLQRLWYEAHYAEAELQRGKKLDPVSRYRVRKKNAFPSTIWDGEGMSYCFKKSARATLKAAYQKQNIPNQQEKQELAKQTKLTVVQVSNWFKNQRQRARQYLKEGRVTASCSGYSSVESECEDDDNENNTKSFFQNDYTFATNDTCCAKRLKITKNPIKSKNFEDCYVDDLYNSNTSYSLNLSNSTDIRSKMMSIDDKKNFSLSSKTKKFNSSETNDITNKNSNATTMAMYAAMYYGAHHQFFQRPPQFNLQQKIQQFNYETETQWSNQIRFFSPFQSSNLPFYSNVNVEHRNVDQLLSKYESL